MITDLIIGVVYQVLSGLVAVFPAMPDIPENIWMLINFFGAANAFLPMSEFLAFFPTMMMIFGLLVLVRIVRLFLPGG